MVTNNDLFPQLSSWMKTASESFLVRFDLGTSLVTTEDLEMEFQEFKARAQVTFYLDVDFFMHFVKLTPDPHPQHLGKHFQNTSHQPEKKLYNPCPIE